MNSEAELVAVAEGYLELGELDEAWEFIEAIPVVQRINPAIVRVRIICSIALKHFEMAEELALFLGTGPSPYRKFAGNILHELAAAHFYAGDVRHAKKLIGDAVRIWPDERFAILEDRQLDGLL